MCTDGSGPVYGLVGVGITTVRSMLDISGQGFVSRIWERAGAEKHVSD